MLAAGAVHARAGTLAPCQAKSCYGSELMREGSASALPPLSTTRVPTLPGQVSGQSRRLLLLHNTRLRVVWWQTDSRISTTQHSGRMHAP